MRYDMFITSTISNNGLLGTRHRTFLENYYEQILKKYYHAEKKDGYNATYYQFDELHKTPKGFDINMIIKKVIFNGPCTIVLWGDGTKTIVRCDNEEFDKEKGLAMAISKKALGNTSKYYNTFKHYIKE